MRQFLIGLFLTLSFAVPVLAEDSAKTADEILAELSSEYPQFLIVTTQGNITVELDARKAPLTVANFYSRVKDGFYVDTIFHRVINGFVAQAGGMTADYQEKDTPAQIPNESGNGLKNKRGTIAMARTNKPHSATTQFFFNLVDNVELDPLATRWGYAVFGEVKDGLDVLDRIAHLPTGPSPDGSLPSDVPQTPVVIKSITLVP
ncbi:MAG: peptidylprolyl isomerase [Gammaproteobacteria bacterium]|nr:peptidylprolyl isomerase [Gammaproteobacteria bacterium]